MVREFCSKEEVFRGVLLAAPDGGWERQGNLFYFFSYMSTARRRISKLVIQQVKGCCRLVLVHTVAIAHAVTVTHTVAPHVVTGTVSIRTGVCAAGSPTSFSSAGPFHRAGRPADYLISLVP